MRNANGSREVVSGNPQSAIRNPQFHLFLVSALILFLELACIRWFPAHVMYLTFFTNTVLLAAFVGMSVGCLTASRVRDHLRATPYWLLLAVGLGIAFESQRDEMVRNIGVGDQRSPEVIFFGTEHAAHSGNPLFPIEVIAGLFFILVALVHVGPGQELGRAFNRIPGRARAYALNLAGSAAGVVLFAVCSQMELPPIAWFALGAVGVGYFLIQLPALTPLGRTLHIHSVLAVVCLIVATALTGLTSGGPLQIGERETRWSPYYRVDRDPDGAIVTNLVSHQQILPLSEPLVAYALPYQLRQATFGKSFERILIVGAGSGNDLSRALQWAAPNARIDAVEIDPVIQGLGVRENPDRPYQDPRVTVHLGDGRNFLHRAADERPGHYDLILFALVDSLVLHSGYSNIRLESFLFTEQAFADVKRCLMPGGWFVAYNEMRQGWLMARLRESMRTAFGADPVVLTYPPLDEMRIDDFYRGFTTFVAGPAEAVQPLREKFATPSRFWAPSDRAPVPGDTAARFRDRPPRDGEGAAIGLTRVQESNGSLRPATDDWPFLYLREPTLPALTLRGAGIVLVVTLGLIWWFLRGTCPSRADASQIPRPRFALDMFFLGAGFMLIETRAIVSMALVFGSTWEVNVFVILGVLLTAFLGNLYAAWIQPKSLWPYFVGLFVCLGLNLAVPLDTFLGLSRPAQIVGTCALSFAPLAFAGVLFAALFARTSDPGRAYGWNVFGALAGGLAENLSLLLGFRYLLIVAIGFYGLAFFGSRGRNLTAAAQNADL